MYGLSELPGFTDVGTGCNVEGCRIQDPNVDDRVAGPGTPLPSFPAAQLPYPDIRNRTSNGQASGAGMAMPANETLSCLYIPPEGGAS